MRRHQFAHPTAAGIAPLAFAAALLLTFTALPAFGADGAVASGTWTKKSFAVEGGWQIVAEGDRLFVELDSSFATRKAPDLKIFLSPKSLGELNGKNATEGSVLVSKLDSHKGAQRYALPEGTDLEAFSTVIVHCEKYRKLWAGSGL